MTTTTTRTRTATVEELYRKPSSFAPLSLCYYRDGWGDHVVKCQIGFLAGRPCTFRFRTVEEARAQWARFRAEIRANGYTLKLGTDGNFKGVN